MAHELSIPLRFRFLKLPAKWEIHDGKRAIGEVGIDSQSPTGSNLAELDGWQCRDEFFRLPQNHEALWRFLTKVGVWKIDPSSLIRQWYGLGRATETIPIDTVWEFRKGLKEGLIDPNEFARFYAPPQPNPKTFVDWLSQTRAYNLFNLAFEVGKLPAAAVTVIGARDMLMATVYADLIRGIKFKYCKRADCGKPFPIESKHKRKFCCQYCAHLESVRKSRRRR